MRRIHFFNLGASKALWAALAVTVCGATALAAQSPAPTAPDPRIEDAGWLNRQMAALYQRSVSQGWTTTPSGLRWRRVKGDGTGAHPIISDRVTVHYVGRFDDGSEFDSSIARGAPATFPLTKVIKGWGEGVPLAGVGDTIELAIPYDLAYGPKGRRTIPPYATLIFTIELLGIEPPAKPDAAASPS